MPAPIVTAEFALKKLTEGNRRYISAEAEHPRQTPARRRELTAGQRPFAIIVSCSDSRVPSELFFDQGFGDLFSIRNAGNVVDDVVLGSIEYAAEYLRTALVVVMGHTNCGAVTAAVTGGEMGGHIASIIQAIQPAVDTSRDQLGDPVMNAILANVRLMVEKIQNSQPLLAPLVQQNRLTVVGALYHIDSGRVQFL
jgi:carbonic anhydrase